MPAEDAAFGTSFPASPWHLRLCPVWEPGLCLTDPPLWTLNERGDQGTLRPFGSSDLL